MPEQQYPDTWPGVLKDQQQPGMVVEGTLVDARVAEGRNNKQFVIVDLKTESGEILSVPAWHYTLNDLLNDEQPQLGAQLKIEYEGEKDIGGGRNPLRLYKVNGRSSQGGGGKRPTWLNGGAPEAAPAAVSSAPKPVAVPQPDDNDMPF